MGLAVRAATRQARHREHQLLVLLGDRSLAEDEVGHVVDHLAQLGPVVEFEPLAVFIATHAQTFSRMATIDMAKISPKSA